MYYVTRKKILTLSTRGYQIVVYTVDVTVITKQRREMGEILDELSR